MLCTSKNKSCCTDALQFCPSISTAFIFLCFENDTSKYREYAHCVFAHVCREIVADASIMHLHCFDASCVVDKLPREGNHCIDIDLRREFCPFCGEFTKSMMQLEWHLKEVEWCEVNYFCLVCHTVLKYNEISPHMSIIHGFWAEGGRCTFFITPNSVPFAFYINNVRLSFMKLFSSVEYFFFFCSNWYISLIGHMLIPHGLWTEALNFFDAIVVFHALFFAILPFTPSFYVNCENVCHFDKLNY